MKESKKITVRMALFIVLGAALVWAAVSLISGYIVPTVEERDTVQSEKALVGATLAPEATPVTRVSLADGQAAGEPVAAATLVPKDDLPRDMPQLLEDYVYLYAVNSNMGGWLRVRAIPRIDFAWVRGKNAYYIHKDFYGRENAGGTAFLDESCRDWPRDENLIIYAHNLKSGDMFGELHRLTDASVLKANPLIDFDTLYEKGVYAPVAVLVCDINPGSAAYFDFN
ncbi:MAG: class B sortase, partial [Clostridia bacterium]|nr:class B sortase [Clostridia bacterium]